LLEFALTKSIIQSQPESIVEINGWKFPDETELADPFFDKPSKINIFLGEGKISLSQNLQYLAKFFTWVAYLWQSRQA